MDQFKKLLLIAGLFSVVLVGVVAAKRYLSEVARDVVSQPVAVDLEREPESPGTDKDGLILETLPGTGTRVASP